MKEINFCVYFMNIINALLFLVGVIVFFAIPILLFWHAGKLKKYYIEHPDEAKNADEKYKRWQEHKEKTCVMIGEVISVLVTICALFLPIFILGYQIMYYLFNGVWRSLSIIDVLQYFKFEWAFSPNSWFGLWTVLDKINISVAIVMAIVLFLFARNSK